MRARVRGNGARPRVDDVLRRAVRGLRARRDRGRAAGQVDRTYRRARAARPDRPAPRPRSSSSSAPTPAPGAERAYLQLLDIDDLDHVRLLAAEVMPHLASSLLENADVRIAVLGAAQPARPAWFLRDADGDIVLLRASAATGTPRRPSTARSRTGRATSCVVPRGHHPPLSSPSTETHLLVRHRRLEGAVSSPRSRPPRPSRALRSRGRSTVPEPQSHDESGEFAVRVRATSETTTRRVSVPSRSTSSAGRAISRRCVSTSTTSGR